jgi:hypothetical protein
MSRNWGSKRRGWKGVGDAVEEDDRDWLLEIRLEPQKK